MSLLDWDSLVKSPRLVTDSMRQEAWLILRSPNPKRSLPSLFQFSDKTQSSTSWVGLYTVKTPHPNREAHRQLYHLGGVLTTSNKGRAETTPLQPAFIVSPIGRLKELPSENTRCPENVQIFVLTGFLWVLYIFLNLRLSWCRHVG